MVLLSESGENLQLEIHGKAESLARSALQCRPLENACEKHLLTDT